MPRAGAAANLAIAFWLQSVRLAGGVAEIGEEGGTTDDMLCEKCQEREATCHRYKICGDSTTVTNLCSECDEAGSPEARAIAEAGRKARCEYCGGQPCFGGPDMFAMMTGVEKLKFMCMPCSSEFQRYIQQQLQPDASDLSTPDELSLFRKIYEEADRHMKQWGSERDSQ